MTFRIEIVAEVGVNHNGSVELACRLAREAAGAGATTVKFQTFHTEKLVSRSAPKAAYQVNPENVRESQFDMLKRLELSHLEFQEVKKCCEECGVEFLATPFDSESVEFLDRKLEVSRFKISSGDVTNGPMLFEVAATGKPVILSTGMSYLAEIELALGVLAAGYLRLHTELDESHFREIWCSSEGRSVLKDKVTLLHCTSQYPAPVEDVNLRAMRTLSDRFGLPVGLSDHTEGIAVAIAAASLGATLIEKHVTLDRGMPGPDHASSLEIDQFRLMVESIRRVEKALGVPKKEVVPSESTTRGVARRSLFAALPIRRGDIFSRKNLIAKRPGTGIPAIEYWRLLGQVANKDYETDDMIER